MFKTDAFGRRIPCIPTLRFIDPPEGGDGGAGGGAGGDEPKSKTPQEQGYDFPPETKVADMTPEQQAHYWRFHARKHEQRADERKDYDDLKAKAQKWVEHEDGQKDENEKALDEARRQGENIGAEKFVRDAVTGELRAITGKTREELADALEVVDVLKFLDDNGSIDYKKVEKYAATLGTSAPDPAKNLPPRDSVKDAIERQRQSQQQARGGGSIASLTAARVAELTPTTR